MNYRHHFHAGNFADVLKHAVLLELVAGLSRKEKAFLYLDTHAGRGRYDLAAADKGDSLARRPEWPEGVGRVWSTVGGSPALAAYREAVRAFDVEARRADVVTGRDLGALEASGPRFYPGSPWLARRALRSQDRMVLCEKHPEEAAILRGDLGGAARTSVQAMDGYTGMRAMLPPPERRALVLIDPPFEEQGEFAAIVAALGEGLRRMPGATYAVWYPLTERARVDAFVAGLRELNPPPCCLVELSVAGPQAGLKMRGCGVAVINPPWGAAATLDALASELATLLAQAEGGTGGLTWVVPE